MVRGQGTDLRYLSGSGSIDVPAGKIYNLPPIVDLLKFLDLRLPDRTFFEEAHIKFYMLGPRLRYNEFELFGNVVSLRGRGDMNLNGTDLNMDMNVDWARLAQLLGPELRRIPQTISNAMLKITVTGDLDKHLKFTQEPVPLLTEPLKKLLGRPTTPAGKPESSPEFSDLPARFSGANSGRKEQD